MEHVASSRFLRLSTCYGGASDFSGTCGFAVNHSPAYDHSGFTGDDVNEIRRRFVGLRQTGALAVHHQNRVPFQIREPFISVVILIELGV